jgi:hypothetical protein
MSDTPETDAFIESLNDDWDYEFAAITSHAKKLERERDEAREELDNIRKTLSESGEAIGNGVHNYSIIEMIENLIQSRDYFVRKSDSLEQERDEARAELEMWRDGNILHEIHRDELEKVERERDEARMQYRTTELLGMELVNSFDQLKAEKAAIFAQLVSLQAGSRRATLDEVAESVREKYQPEHEGEVMDNG